MEQLQLQKLSPLRNNKLFELYIPLFTIIVAILTSIYRFRLTSSYISSSSDSDNNVISSNNPNNNPNNIPTTYAFAALRESVLSYDGAYVHPDLGILKPGPWSGADRGLGMVRDTYSACMEHCCEHEHEHEHEHEYCEENVLLKIPLAAQMTRSVSMETLRKIIPAEVRQMKPLYVLDDAALLVLLLAHEKGLGQDSRFGSYIMNLPKDPMCGYSPHMRKNTIDMVALYSDKYSVDVNGWPAEISKAADYADRIASSLANDYGAYIKVPPNWSPLLLINWSLCTVASRATGGSESHGKLRLVPILDMVNHDSLAGGFVELLGHERVVNGDFINATESDAGTFVVRSVKDGKPYKLKKGMELLANYNVPSYSPLDWYLNLGFIPPERQVRWTFLDSPLPKMNKRR